MSAAVPDRGAGARADFEARIGRRTGEGAALAALPPPSGLRATAGRGQVTLTWQPVDGAVGYLVHRADAEQGPFEVVDHGGNDVLAVPHPPYLDTGAVGGGASSVDPTVERWYAVRALADVSRPGPLSTPVAARAVGDGPARVQVQVDAGTSTGRLHRPWRPMLGSEHLSLVLSEDEVGGRRVGAETREALRLAHDELGVRAVRAHAILCDDVGVYREVDGEPVYDFSRVDAVYDAVLEAGMRPVVELSFMPRDLARDPSRTVFAYDAVISPPKDWDRWAELVTRLAAHLVQRYGLEEVREHWSFEVWNEANLDVFWSGTREEYLRLYDVSARAVRAVDDRLTVGGPSSAAAQWVGELVEHVGATGSPLDFVSTHTYGSPPLDLRPVLARHERSDARIWWTEWGPGSQHFHEVGDSVFAATFLLDGMRSAMDRVDALAHWVVSDHFEELGRPTRLAHGGFGLLTVGNLRKPRWWALSLLERLGDVRLAVALHGDGAGSLVDAVAARHDDGRVGVLVWNGTLDQSKIEGSALLARDVALAVDGLPAGRWRVRHWRVDAEHSDVYAVWRARSDGRDWPKDDEWEALRAANTLAELDPVTVDAAPGTPVRLAFPLPQPGLSFLELTKAEPT